MGGLLSLLSPALTVGTQAAGAVEQGKAERAQKDQADALKTFQLMRQFQQDKAAEEARGIQNAHTQALTELLRNPQETFGDIEMGVDPATGKPKAVQRGNRGTIRDVPNFAPPQKATPVYEERKENGGVAIYSDGQFQKWKVSPPSERQSGSYNDVRRDARLDRLQGNFEGSPQVKDAQTTASALAPVATSLKLNTPLGDVMALYAIVKLFDPGSVVKEGEIKLAASANNLPDKVRLVLENAAYGRKLTPAYRPQIEALAREITEQRRAQVRPIQARFGAQVRSIGGTPADSAYVAPDPFEGQAKYGGVELIPAPKTKGG